MNQEGSKEMKKMKLEMKNGLKIEEQARLTLRRRSPSSTPPENEETRRKSWEADEEQWRAVGRCDLARVYKDLWRRGAKMEVGVVWGEKTKWVLCGGREKWKWWWDEGGVRRVLEKEEEEGLVWLGEIRVVQNNL